MRRSSVDSVTSIQRSGQTETFVVTENDNSQSKTKCVGCVAMSKTHSVDDSDEKFDKVKKNHFVFQV